MRHYSTNDPETGKRKTGAPALSRGLAVLREIAARPEGAGAAELAGSLGIPRATLYRLLATLVDGGFAQPASPLSARYVLGPALGRIAGTREPERDLVELARPVMDLLARELGETVKLVVRDGLEALTVAASIPRRDSCIASRVGARLPLYVGASQRLLLAHASLAVRDRVLAGPLDRVASRTITHAGRLRAELAVLAGRRVFASHGEGVEGVGATAVLIGRPRAEPKAALVTVYVFASQGQRRLADIRRATIRAAETITTAVDG